MLLDLTPNLQRLAEIYPEVNDLVEVVSSQSEQILEFKRRLVALSRRGAASESVKSCFAEFERLAQLDLSPEVVLAMLIQQIMSQISHISSSELASLAQSTIASL